MHPYKPAHLFSDDPRRCIRRTIRDCRGCRSSPSVCRFGRCGNRRGIVLRLDCCERLGPGVQAVLVGVDIGVAAFVGVLLQQAAAVPDEMGTFRLGTRPSKFVFSFLTQSSSERVVGVCPDLGIAGGLFDFGADELVFEIVLVILVFAIGQLAVNQVAQGVVLVFCAVEFGDSVAVGAV